MDLTAASASVDDDEPLFGVGLCADGLHLPLAFAGAISGVDIHVEGPEAEGAVIARGIAQGLHGFSAVLADKATVIFDESFLLHVGRILSVDFISNYVSTKAPKSQ